MLSSIWVQIQTPKNKKAAALPAANVMNDLSNYNALFGYCSMSNVCINRFTRKAQKYGIV